MTLPGHILPHLLLLRQSRLAPHPLRQRQPPDGMHRHQEKRRHDPRRLLLRRTRLRMDAPLVRLIDGRVGQGDTGGNSHSRGQCFVRAKFRQLWIFIPSLAIVLFHPSGDSEYDACGRGGDCGIVVVFSRGCHVLLLGGVDGKSHSCIDYFVWVHLLWKFARGDYSVVEGIGANGEESRQWDLDLSCGVHFELS